MNVAVIVPLFNGASWIRQALDSILTQSRRPAEIVVVDDGSTDGSQQIVAGYSGVSLLRNPGKGANPARNFGAKHTRSPLISFLDQDDVWHPDHLRILCDLLEKNPHYPAVVGSVQAFNHSHPVFSGLKSGSTPLNPWTFFPFNQIDTPSAVVIRRHAFMRCGLWSQQFPHTADYYLWLRLSVSAPLGKSLSITVGRRLHNNSYSVAMRTRRASKYLAEMASASEHALLYRLPLFPVEEAYLRDRLAVFEAFTGILRAMNASDDAQLTAPAVLFEQSMASEDADIVHIACKLFLWLLEPFWIEHMSERILASLFDRWPVFAPRTRAVMRHVAKQVVPYPIFVKLVRASPTCWYRWCILADVLRLRFLKRLRELLPV